MSITPETNFIFTDISGTAQLLVFIRMLMDDFTSKEILLYMISLKERTRGFDIFQGESLLHEIFTLQISINNYLWSSINDRT